MSSEDAGVVMFYLPQGVGEEPPFPARVGVPATAGKRAVLDARVDAEIARWTEREDWAIGRVTYSTEPDEDGVRRRFGTFTVTGYKEDRSA